MNMCRTQVLLFLFVLGPIRFCGCFFTTAEYTTSFYDTTDPLTDYSTGLLSEDDFENTSAAIKEKSTICQTEGELRVTEPKITARSIALSWQPLSISTKCNVKYDINITKAIYDPKEIPYFRHESSTHHTFARLKACTAYNISVKPSSGKLFKTTLRTLPGKVYLRLNESGGHTYAEWEEPLNPECNRYNITLGNQSSIQENITSFDLGLTEDIRCTQVALTPLDNKNRSGETITREVPGAIKNLRATSENHVINLTWEPPDDPTCVVEYVITVGDAEYTTSQPEYTISDLEACYQYDGTVAAASETDLGSPSDFSIKTTSPSTPTVVTDLKFNLDGQVLNTTWSPPAKMGACIRLYNINIWDQNGQSLGTHTTTEPYFVIEPVGPCVEYNFQVVPQIGNNQGPNVFDVITIAASATAPPTLNTVTAHKTTLDAVVVLEGYNSNRCNITEVIVDCTFSGDELLVWMKESSIASIVYKDSSGRPRPTVTVPDLSEYTNYTCTVTVINSGGTSEGTEFETRTLEEVPSAPENLTWEELETFVNISWEPPLKVPGIMGPYEISINHTKFLHYTACDVTVINITSESTDNTIFSFGDAEPNSEYAVNVAASTSVGYGDVAEMVFTTRPKESGIPREVRYVFENKNSSDYNASVTLNWIVPCNTNGELIRFQCILYGENTENGNAIETKDIDRNVDNTDHNYSVLFALLPLYNYRVELFAITKASDGEELLGEKEELSFSSPDGYPTAPLNLMITDITSTSASFKWDEPANKNGELISYTLRVEVGNFLQEIPDCDYNRTTLEFILGPDETQYHFTGFPYYNYIVTVAASTKAGLGTESQPERFQTAADVPDSVRDVDTEDIVNDEEKYNVQLKVKYVPPCHINGQFDHYEIQLTGLRDGDVHNETKSLTGFEDHAVIFTLKPEYNYAGHVRVHTREHVSKPFDIPQYISPSGVPIASITSLRDPDVIDSYTANFVLERGTFDPSEGIIHFYAIILSPLDESDTKDGYAFWRNTSWPESGFWSEDGALGKYQTTPERWNPFEDNDESTYTFKIGTESCDGTSYCNGKLRPDTDYHLRVRGFTTRAYRDTIPVKFYTPAKLNLGALIGGILGACAALAVIFIAGFIFWRRRRKEKDVDEEDPFENPLIPSPFAIKAFVDHYNDYKTNLNKLKSEYTLLERKSAEQQLSTSFALTDDNKRKNRYINILPYDETRVKLDRDKNDNYTDYINASYIKGYSDNIEYIATQGPLEPTVVDFWRMVIQENVSLIVMVAQFVEQNKPKCYQYFPNNHEMIDIGDGIEIRCATELPFEGYIKRTLLVQRELMQMTITHLQFTEWPDFGCPNDTDSMLDFCNVMRQIVEQHKSKTIIHCSAGVGRTGTLIAIDILMQTIENKGDIDVFKTVLDLRKQRIRMVQTEKQYMFIHSCLAQHILDPKIPEKKVIDPIYENVTITQANGGTAESAL